MNQPKFYIGIDLGGTAIKLAIIDDRGNIVDKSEEPTGRNGKDAVLDQITAMIDKLLKMNNMDMAQVTSVGIGVPGFIDWESGYVYELVNLKWKDVRLKEELQQRIALPVFVENDANAAALGELWVGAGQNARSLVMVTLGTGVGGGVVINGDVIHGANGMGGEIGHLSLLPEDGPLCNCGKKGCLETLASATAVARMGREAAESGESGLLHALLKSGQQITARDVVEAAAQGDEKSREIMDRVTYHLGWGLSLIANTINPDRMVIGGGLSRAGEILFNPLRESFRQFSLKRVYEACEIIPAQLGNDAGVIGAAWVARNRTMGE